MDIASSPLPPSKLKYNFNYTVLLWSYSGLVILWSLINFLTKWHSGSIKYSFLYNGLGVD